MFLRCMCAQVRYLSALLLVVVSLQRGHRAQKRLVCLGVNLKLAQPNGGKQVRAEKLGLCRTGAAAVPRFGGSNAAVEVQA